MKINTEKKIGMKLISIILAAMMCISFFPLTVFADDIIIEQGQIGDYNGASADFGYTIDSNGVFTVVGSSMMPDFEVKVGSKYYRGIYLYPDDGSDKVQLSTKTGVSKLSIPSGITTIGKYAFASCSNFTDTLVIPDTVTSISTHAFQSCGFTGILTIPTSVTTIGSSAFYGNTGFTGDLYIPDSVTSIGSTAFGSCSGFNGTLRLPSGITTVSDSCFNNCTGFTGNLVIPEGVTSIEGSAFMNCSGFNGTLTLPSTLKSIKLAAFSNCTGFSGDLYIPDGITQLNPDVFRLFGKNNGGGTLHLPASLTKIYYTAFYGSGFVGDLVIPEGVTEIGQKAFYSTDFTSLSLPSTLTKIDSRAFQCWKLSGTLEIPDSVTSLNGCAFHGAAAGDNMLEFFSDHPELIIVDDSDPSCTVIKCSGCSDVIKKIYNSDSASVPLYVGNSLTLDRDLIPSTIPQTSGLRFVSIDDTVASVTEDGIVTGVSEGDTDVIATSVNDKMSSFRYNMIVRAPSESDAVTQFELADSSDANIALNEGESYVVHIDTDYTAWPYNSSYIIDYNGSELYTDDSGDEGYIVSVTTDSVSDDAGYVRYNSFDITVNALHSGEAVISLLPDDGQSDVDPIVLHVHVHNPDLHHVDIVYAPGFDPGDKEYINVVPHIISDYNADLNETDIRLNYIGDESLTDDDDDSVTVVSVYDLVSGGETICFTENPFLEGKTMKINGNFLGLDLDAVDFYITGGLAVVVDPDVPDDPVGIFVYDEDSHHVQFMFIRGEEGAELLSVPDVTSTVYTMSIGTENETVLPPDTSITLRVGDELEFIAMSNPINAIPTGDGLESDGWDSTVVTVTLPDTAESRFYYTMTGASAGETAVRFYYTGCEGNVFEYIVPVTVLPPIATGIIINNKASISEMNVGSEDDIIINLVPSGAVGEISYNSSDTSVITVSSTGHILALSEGTARITVTVDNDAEKTDYVDITVVNSVPVLSDIYINNIDDLADLYVGECVAIGIDPIPAGADIVDVSFASENSAIAIVDDNGQVTGLSAGTVNITVSAGEIVKSIPITVHTIAGCESNKIIIRKGESDALGVYTLPVNGDDLRFTSTDTAVATVSADGNVFGCNVGTALINVTDNYGSSRDITVRVVDVTVAPINTNDIIKGEPIDINVITDPNGLEYAVEYDTNDPTVIEIIDGEPVPVGPGTTEIIVTTTVIVDGEAIVFIDTISVTVTDATGISVINKDEMTELIPGETKQIEIEFEPENAFDKNVVYTSSDATIVTVNEDGVITAVSPGTTVITVKHNDIEESFEVTVYDIIVPNSRLVIAEGATSDTVVTSEGSAALQFTVSPAGIATAAEGKVTGNNTGAASVTVTDGRITKSFDVIVVGIELIDAEPRTPVVVPAGAGEIVSVTYSSSDESIATVDNNGVITDVDNGIVTITVTVVINVDGQNVEVVKSYSHTSKIPVNSVTAIASNNALDVDNEPYAQITVTVDPYNAGDKRVTYTSSDARVVKVDTNGKVTAVGKGNAVVTIVSKDDPTKNASVPFTVTRNYIDIQIPSKVYIEEPTNIKVVVDSNQEYTVEYKSSDDRVVTVDENGRITAVAEGSAQITVTVRLADDTVKTKTVTVVSAHNGGFRCKKCDWWDQVKDTEGIVGFIYWMIHTITHLVQSINYLS